MHKKNSKSRFADRIQSVGLWLTSLLVIGILIVSGCSRTQTSNAIPESDEPVVTVASTTQIEIIQASLRNGVTVADAYAVRSETDDWAHFIAARLDGIDAGEASSGDIGLWFMQDGMDVPGDHYAVNSVAKGLSNMSAYDDQIVQLERRDVALLLELTESRRLKVYP